MTSTNTKFAVVACTLVTSITLLLGAVGPATATAIPVPPATHAVA
jgi:hypothetical protein